MLRQAHPLARSSFLFPSPLAAKIFIATTPQMPFSLLEFISFGLSSLNSEVYFPMRDLFAPCGADGSYISPGPLQRPGDFFCPSPRKRRSGSALASGAPVADAHFLLQSSRFPILRARFTQSAPSARPFSATVPRHPRLRPRPPPAARNTVPFTPSPRPPLFRPTTLHRRRLRVPPRTGRQGDCAPRRTSFGLSTGKA